MKYATLSIIYYRDIEKEAVSLVEIYRHIGICFPGLSLSTKQQELLGYCVSLMFFDVQSFGRDEESRLKVKESFDKKINLLKLYLK